jgi:hypothetical protein
MFVYRCFQEGLGSLIVPRDISGMYKQSITVTPGEPVSLSDVRLK